MSSIKTGLRSRWIRDILLLTLAISLLLGFQLGNRALWEPDEGRYSEIPREMVTSGDYITPRLNGVKYFERPPLFYWMQAAAIKVFGLHEWSLRLSTATLALLGCMTIYLAGLRMFSRRAGFIAAVVLATNIYYYQMGRTISLDMPVTAFLTIGLLAFLLGTREPPGRSRRMLMWTFYVSAALATLSKGLIGIIIPGMVIGAWVLLLNNWRLLREIHLPSGLLLFLLIAAPWHILVSVINPEFPAYYFINEHLMSLTTTIRRRYEPMWFFVPVLLVGLLPWIAFLLQSIRFSLPASWAARHEEKEALFLMLWAGLVFVFFSVSESKLVPHILPAFPPLALLIGRYLAKAWRHDNAPGLRTSYWILLGTGVALAAILGFAPQGSGDAADYRGELGNYLRTAAMVVVGGGVVTFVLGQIRFYLAFLSLAATTVVFLGILTTALPLLDAKNSSRQLALVLKPLLRPDTEVMNYHRYYQDLPVYLERRITVVGYKGELEFGSENGETDAWMIDEETFWQRWQISEPVYMLTKRIIYDQLAADHPGKFFLLAESGRNVLLANKEIKP
jgi:4-amino-4-deoxy-L-arabinose transferase-like glycosyltransferase